MDWIELEERLEKLEKRLDGCGVCWYTDAKPKPTVGKKRRQYIHETTGATYIWDGSAYVHQNP